MKICVVSSFPPAQEGIANYCFRLCEALLTVNSDLRILVLSNERFSSSEPGSRLEVIEAWSRTSFFFPLRIFRIIKYRDPQIVHCQHEPWLYGRNIRSITFPLLLVVLRFLRKPVIVTMHWVTPREELTSGFFEKHNLGSNLSFAKESYLVSYMKLIGSLASKTVVHLGLAKSILVSGYGYRTEKVQVIPHGIDVDTIDNGLTKEQAKERLGIQNKTALLFFGGIRRDKGLEHLIKAMPEILARNPETVLLVTGQSNLKYYTKVSPESMGYIEELMDLSKSLGLEGKVIFRGRYLPNSYIPIYFTAADVVVFPYVQDENIAASGPLSTALAFSKPIVASRIRRFTDYLKDGENALLVKPADPNSLADTLNLLLRDRELSRRLSDGARSLAHGKTWKDVAQQTFALYERLCDKPEEKKS